MRGSQQASTDPTRSVAGRGSAAPGDRRGGGLSLWDSTPFPRKLLGKGVFFMKRNPSLLRLVVLAMLVAVGVVISPILRVEEIGRASCRERV